MAWEDELDSVPRLHLVDSSSWQMHNDVAAIRVKDAEHDFAFGKVIASIYLDIRNAFNITRVEAVRRDTGTPTIDEDALQAQAKAAYDAHPEPIPYESPRYRAYADLDANGIIAGEGELLPLYVRAARDYNTPVFQYGSPRLFRLGFEVMF